MAFDTVEEGHFPCSMVKAIIHEFQSPVGMNLPVAQERLVEYLGKDAVDIVSRLLDDVSLDGSDGRSRLPVHDAIKQARESWMVNTTETEPVSTPEEMRSLSPVGLFLQSREDRV
jgi:hypothetical protein